MTVTRQSPDNGYPQLTRGYPRKYASESDQGSSNAYYRESSYPQNTSMTNGYRNQYPSESRSYPANNPIERTHNLDHEPAKTGQYQGPYPTRTHSGNWRYYSGTGTPEAIPYQQPRTESSTNQDTYKSRLQYYNGKGDCLSWYSLKS